MSVPDGSGVQLRRPPAKKGVCLDLSDLSHFLASFYIFCSIRGIPVKKAPLYKKAPPIRYLLGKRGAFLYDILKLARRRRKFLGFSVFYKGKIV